MDLSGRRMDLANGYNYFSPETEWYHAARTKFLNGELGLHEGLWGKPYFDLGAGNIEMAT